MAERAQVLKLLVEAAPGAMIDTAPSYGEAETVLGKLFELTKLRDKIFLATKVTVDEPAEQVKSMRESLKLMGVKQVQLMQLHNPKNPKQDIATLRAFQKEGLCKYIGISSSFDRDYKAVEDGAQARKAGFLPDRLFAGGPQFRRAADTGGQRRRRSGTDEPSISARSRLRQD